MNTGLVTSPPLDALHKAFVKDCDAKAAEQSAVLALQAKIDRAIVILARAQYEWSDTPAKQDFTEALKALE